MLQNSQLLFLTMQTVLLNNANLWQTNIQNCNSLYSSDTVVPDNPGTANWGTASRTKAKKTVFNIFSLFNFDFF